MKPCVNFGDAAANISIEFMRKIMVRKDDDKPRPVQWDISRQECMVGNSSRHSCQSNSSY